MQDQNSMSYPPSCYENYEHTAQIEKKFSPLLRIEVKACALNTY